MASYNALPPLLLEKAILSSVISTVQFTSKVHVFGCICVTVDGNEAGSVTIKLNKFLGQLDKKSVSNDRYIEESLNELRSSCRRRSKSFDGSLSNTDENENLCVQKSAFKRSCLTSKSVSCNNSVGENSVKKVECSKLSVQSSPSIGGLSGKNTDPMQRHVLEKALKEFIKVKYQQKQSGKDSSPVNPEASGCGSPVPPEFLKLVALQARIMGVPMPSDTASLNELSASAPRDDQLSALLKDIQAKTPHGISDLVLNSDSVRNKPVLVQTVKSTAEISEVSPEKGITKQKRLSFTGNEDKYQEEQGAFAKAMHNKLNFMKTPVVMDKSATSPRTKRKSLFRTGSEDKRRAFVKDMLQKSFGPHSRKRPGEIGSGSNSPSKSLISEPSSCKSESRAGRMGSPAKIAKLHIECEIRDRKPSLTPPEQLNQIKPERDIFKDLLMPEVTIKREPHDLNSLENSFQSKQAISKPKDNNNYTFEPIEKVPTNEQVETPEPNNLNEIQISQLNNEGNQKVNGTSTTKECDELESRPDDIGEVDEVPQAGHSFLSQESLDSLAHSDLDYESDCDTTEFAEQLPFADIDEIPDMPVFVSKKPSNLYQNVIAKEDVVCSNEDSNSSVGSVGFEPTSKNATLFKLKSESGSGHSQINETSKTDQNKVPIASSKIQPVIKEDQSKNDISEYRSTIEVLSRPKSRQRKSKPVKLSPKPERRTKNIKLEAKRHKSSCSACSEKKAEANPCVSVTKSRTKKNTDVKSAFTNRVNSDSSIVKRNKSAEQLPNSDSSILKVLKSQCGTILKVSRSSDLSLNERTNNLKPVTKNTKSKSTPSLVCGKTKWNMGTSNLSICKSMCNDVKVTSNVKQCKPRNVESSTSVTKYDMSILKKIRPVPDYEIDVDFAENPYPSNLSKSVSSKSDTKKVSDKFILRGSKSQSRPKQSRKTKPSRHTTSSSTSSVSQRHCGKETKYIPATHEKETNDDVVNFNPNQTDPNNSGFRHSMCPPSPLEDVTCGSVAAGNHPQPSIQHIISKRNRSTEMQIRALIGSNELGSNGNDKGSIKNVQPSNVIKAVNRSHQSDDTSAEVANSKTVINNPVETVINRAAAQIGKSAKSKHVDPSIYSSDNQSKANECLSASQQSLQNYIGPVLSIDTFGTISNGAAKPVSCGATKCVASGSSKASAAAASVGHLLVRSVPVISSDKVIASPKIQPDTRHVLNSSKRSPFLVNDHSLTVDNTTNMSASHLNDSTTKVTGAALERLQKCHFDSPQSPCRLKLKETFNGSSHFGNLENMMLESVKLRVTPLNIPLEKEMSQATSDLKGSATGIQQSNSIPKENASNPRDTKFLHVSKNKENEEFVKCVLSPNGSSTISPSKTKRNKRRSRGSAKRKQRSRTNSNGASSEVWQVPTEYQRGPQGSGRCGKAKNSNGGQHVDAAGFKMKKYWLDMYGPGSPMAPLKGSMK